MRHRNDHSRSRYLAPSPRNESSRQRDASLRQRSEPLRQRIAAAAARLIAEDGIEDFSVAKRKAARQLGATDSQALPGNEAIEAELRAYQALYQADEQRERIRSLRLAALRAMRDLAAFQPYLAGAVLRGIAGRYSGIDLQLFTDDSKAVELYLLSRRVTYTVAGARHFAGDQARLIPVLTIDWEGIPVHLAVHPGYDERVPISTTAGGRPIERAGVAALLRLIESDD